jgi:hypothetical protein
MGWVNWSRKSNATFAAATGAMGVDLNATRIRVITGEPGRTVKPVVLDEPSEELQLAVSLANRTPEVGISGRSIERKTPHLGCFDFLGAIGQARRWDVGRHKLSALDLMGLVLNKMRAASPTPLNMSLTVPVHLNGTKVTAIAQLMERAKLPLRGSVVLPLALIAASDPNERRPRLTLLIDVDDHALTGSLLQIDGGVARLLSTIIEPKLNLRAWKGQLLDGLSDRCVRVCRRDPRDSADAEQALYEQIDDAMERARQGQRMDLSVRTTQWYQNLIQTSEDFEGYCAGQIKTAVASLRELVQAAPEPPQAVWLTSPAARLPGLAVALHAHLPERTGLAAMPPDAGARAALLLASIWVRDELPRTHLDSVIPLPELPAREAGQAPYRETNGAKSSIRVTRHDN